MLGKVKRGNVTAWKNSCAQRHGLETASGCKQSTMAQVLETFLSDTFITEVHCASHSESGAREMWFFSNHIKYACWYILERRQKEMDVLGILGGRRTGSTWSEEKTASWLGGLLNLSSAA